MKNCFTQILSKCIEDKYGNDPMVTKLKADLEETKKVFTQMKGLEDAVMDTFQTLENHISKQETEEASKKLDAITKTGDEINTIKTVNFPEKKEKPFVRQQQSFSNDENKKMPENSSRSQIEQDPSPSTSYEKLPPNKKNCLLTLAVFPENEVIKKRILIHWWIGEGFATESGDMSAEELGEKIFDELTDEGWIQPSRNTKKSPTIYGCTMSPETRTMLISKAQQSNRLILDRGRSSNIDNHPQGSLLTIFNLHEKYLSPKEDLFSKIRDLKVLQLGRWQISPRHHIEVENCKFFDRLKIQKELTYLSLRGISQIITLPDSMGKCINLEILDLKACHNLERLFDMRNLTKLAHLNVSECYLLSNEFQIHPSLQVLKGIKIYNFDESEFRKSQRLRVITLIWPNVTLVNRSKASHSNEDLLVFPLVEKLQLTCYPLQQLPSFTFPDKSPNLKRLYIKGGSLKNLSPSGPFKVEILRLNYLKSFRLDESFDMQKQFPNLLYLEKLNRHSPGADKADIEWKFEDGWHTLNDKLKQ